jgi:ABC-type Fe3+-hydroxamate transport system substrate-binding protein
VNRLIALCLLASFVACSAPQAPGVPPSQRRIVALVPTMTEDLFAIGAGAQVVGVSAFTDVPVSARHLPHVADFSSIDAEKIVALHPDLVVGIASQESLVQSLRRANLRVLLMNDDSLDDIFSILRTLGDESGHRKQADAVVAQLRRRTSSLHSQANRFTKHPRVFVALGSGPIWTVGDGSYIAQLLKLAGARNAASGLSMAYGEYSAEALLRAQPDAIVTGNDTHLPSVLDREPWRSLRAVREHHVYVIANDDLLYRPGPRYNEGLHWLIERLAPQAK